MGVNQYMNRLYLNRIPFRQFGFVLILISLNSCQKEFDIDSPSNSSIRYFVGGLQDHVTTIQKTSDGGFIYCGNSFSLLNSNDAFLMKVDKNGNKVWYQTYGGPNDDRFNDVIQTSDGGFLALGSTNSFGKGTCDSTSNKFDYVVKTDAMGNQKWAKSLISFGAANTSNAYAAVEVNTNSYLITGSVNYNNATHPYIQRISSEGRFSFDSIYPYNYVYGNFSQIPPYMIHSNYWHVWGTSIIRGNAGHILIGGLMSLSGIPGEAGKYLNYIMDIDPATAGASFFHPYYEYVREWQAYTGNTTNINTLLNDGYLIATQTEPVSGKCKMELIRTDFSGWVIWEKKFDGLGYSILYNIHKNDDGTFLLIGASSKDPINNSFPEQFANLKMAMIKVDLNGNEIWSRYIGGDVNISKAMCVQQSDDGGYRMAAYSSSAETGFSRCFTIKVDKNGNLITE
jgi:hypothetical protein